MLNKRLGRKMMRRELRLEVKLFKKNHFGWNFNGVKK